MIRSKLAREKAHNILAMFKFTEPPVNVISIAEGLGFKVVPHDFPDTMSATIFLENNIKAIGVNKNHPNVRQSFSIAHELGHYLSGHEDFSYERKTFIEKDKRYLDPHHRDEEEADEFAAELLMPDFMLKRDVLENKLDISALSKKYEVSEQAMTIQLVNLKLLPNL